MASTAILAAPGGSLIPQQAGPPDLEGLRLRIFDRIEPGFGVVAVTGNDAGSHMLRDGEIAVYDERWHDRLARGECEMEAGLYCLEWQRSPHSMPDRMVADRFLRGERVKMVCNRQVVFAFPWPRDEQHWAYRELRSRLHHGVRLPARTEGPIYSWAIHEMLLGPVVGVYRPHLREVGR